MKRNAKTLKLICNDCKASSNPYPIRSPAAPKLSVCEQAEKDGWAYTIGFYAMLLGETTWCPDCAAARSLKGGVL